MSHCSISNVVDYEIPKPIIISRCVNVYVYEKIVFNKIIVLQEVLF